MFTVVPTPGGLTFYEWQDVLHEVSHGDVLPDWHKEGFPPEDEKYLDLEAIGAQAAPELPSVVRFGRGVGNWKSPMVCLICNEIVCRLKMESYKWHGLRPYTRPRPFSTNSLDRKFITKLMDYSGLPYSEFYITAASKPWTAWEDGVDSLRAELGTVKPKQIICLGNSVAAYIRKYIRPDIRALDQPNREQYKLHLKRMI